MPNTMYTYPYIEDYIEIIAGFRLPNGASNHSMFNIPDSLISLARYDVKVVDSFAVQTTNGVGFTDRQAVLARELVYKYERQLRKHNVDVSTVKENPQYRNPIRQLDRSQRAWVEDNCVHLRFPYNVQLIEQLREFSRESQGAFQWNQKTRTWESALTEYNVNWIVAFARTNNFEVDGSLQDYMDMVLAVEQQPYNIQLRVDQNCLTIDHAANSLCDYVQTHLGGFGLDNLIPLVDYSCTLGYSVESDIENAVISAYGTRFYSLCVNRELKVDLNTPMQDQVSEIVKYATHTNRFPIYVYEPDMSDRLVMLFIRHFEKEQIADLDRKDTINSNTKLVYARKIPKSQVDHIPLLISSAGMLFGGERQMWLQAAEKSIYFTKEVFGKRNVGKNVARL